MLQPIRVVCYSLNMPDAFLTQTLLLLFLLLDCPSSRWKFIYPQGSAQILLYPQNKAEVTEPKLNSFSCSLCKRSNPEWHFLPSLGLGVLEHRHYVHSWWPLPHVPISLPWMWSIHVCCTNVCFTLGSSDKVAAKVFWQIQGQCLNWNVGTGNVLCLTSTPVLWLGKATHVWRI